MKQNDPAGKEGIENLIPGQRRVYNNVRVRKLAHGEYSLSFKSGKYRGYHVWYRFAKDALMAIQLGMPIEPEEQFTIAEVSGRKFEQPNRKVTRRPKLP